MSAAAPAEDPRTILVRGPNWTGDLVMATPGFRALRARFPAARIVLWARAGLEPLLEGAPWFDAVETTRPGPRGLAAWPARAGRLWSEARALRRRHGPFELGLCLPDSWSSALQMRAAGVGRIVGYQRAGRGALLHQAVAPDPAWGRRRMVARERFVLGLMEAVGCEARGTELELFTTEAEERAAESLLAEAGLAPGREYVALAPGASYGPSKWWPAESFGAVGDALAGAGYGVVVVGTAGERALADGVRRAMAEPVADLCGRSGLGVLKAILRRASLLVCNDAGARHVAVAFGVPVVMILGPTSLAKTDLNLERVDVLSSDVACRPCYRRHCPIDHRCMTRIHPDAVVEQARTALARAGVAHA